jgi:hypothetical protein
MAAGREATPGDAAATDRLMRYWAEGEGAAKVAWGTPGSYDRCIVELGKFVHNDGMLHGLCANLYHRATGTWPGAHAHGKGSKEGS